MQIRARECVLWWRLDREGPMLDEGRIASVICRSAVCGNVCVVLAPAWRMGLYRLNMPVSNRAASIRARFALMPWKTSSVRIWSCCTGPGPRREDGRIAAAWVEQEHMHVWQAFVP